MMPTSHVQREREGTLAPTSHLEMNIKDVDLVTAVHYVSHERYAGQQRPRHKAWMNTFQLQRI